MKIIRLIILFYLLFGSLGNILAQNDTIQASVGNGADFQQYILSHLAYPEFAAELGIQGKVVLSFQVTTSGCLDSIKVLESPDMSLSNEAIRVLKLTECKWIPAKIKDKPVRSSYSFPIYFRLKPDEGDCSSLEEAVKKSENVRFLVLKNKGYNEIPNEVFKCKKLYRLELDSNSIAKIPNEITQLKNLAFLILRSNKIEMVTSELCNLKKLYYLDLSNNSFATIPSEIIALSGLCELRLNNNKLGEIPKEITNMKSLRRLSISNTGLLFFPKQLLNNKKLFELDLSNNSITEIPEEIIKLKNLSKLDLSYNKISRLPDNISNLKLWSLNLTGNNISDIEISRIRALLPKTIIVFK